MIRFLVVTLASLGILLAGQVWITPSIDWTQRHAIIGALDYLRPILLFVLTITGIIAKSLYEALSLRKRVDRPLGFLGSVIKSTGTLKSLVISPIVFMASYKLAATQPDDVVALLLAFQNGFFWQAVLASTTPNETPL